MSQPISSPLTTSMIRVINYQLASTDPRLAIPDIYGSVYLPLNAETGEDEPKYGFGYDSIKDNDSFELLERNFFMCLLVLEAEGK